MAHERRVVRSLAEHFARLTEQRDRRGVRYPLAPLLVLLRLAKLCEADKPQAIAPWVAYRADWLTQTLRWQRKRMPPPATWRRVLAWALALPEFEEVASQFRRGLAKVSARELNLDGKSLRGTRPTGETHGLKLLALQHSTENL